MTLLETARATTIVGGPRFVCDCGRSYKYRSNLNQHKRLECGKAPQFSCPVCPYKAKQKSSLKSHFVNKHSDLPFPF
ncbi:hypothetical protein J6590_014831 [Homalodisca vitripennis]|nr:hypothetical protein J6590_014831 [Homalodisca vitripennis]